MQQPSNISVEYIELDLDLLNTANNLQLTFDNKNYTVSNDSIAIRTPQSYSWFGRNVNGFGYIIITVSENNVQGIIRNGIESYKIVTSSANLRPAVVKIDQSQYPQEYCVFPNANKQNLENNQNAETNFLKEALDTGCPLRALIMYTPAAETGITEGGTTTSSIIDEIYSTVEEMNETFLQSEITNYPAVEIVLIQKWNYTENSNISVDKNNFRDDNYVKTLRTLYNADFCMLIGEDSDFYGKVCGVADDLGAEYDTAFGVVANNCLKTNYSFAHELGHLLGAHHDTGSAGFTPKAYGHGYIYFPGRWRTIMSYNAPPCVDTVFADYCFRIPYWSNPHVDHPEDMIPMGTTTDEDNSRVCREYNNDLAQLEQPATTLTLTNSNYATNNNKVVNLEVKESINTSGIITINNGANISMKARQRITLNSGFKSRANSRVHISNQTFEDCP